jgi:hypothetical protein
VVPEHTVDRSLELTAQKLEICRLCGLLEEFGPAGGNYTGEREEQEIIEELTGLLAQAVALAVSRWRLRPMASLGKKKDNCSSSSWYRECHKV